MKQELNILTSKSNSFFESVLVSLLVASIPLAGWSIFNLGGTFSFTPSYALAAISIIIALFCRKSNVMTRALVQMVVASLLFPVIISTISILFLSRSNEVQFFKSLTHMLFFIVFLISFLSISRKLPPYKYFFSSYLAVSLSASIFSIIQGYYFLILGSPIELNFNIATGVKNGMGEFFSMPRLVSVFLEPGWFAHFNILSLIIAWAWAWPQISKFGGLISKSLFLIFILFVSIITILTFSASAIVVAFLVLIYSRLVIAKSILNIIISIVGTILIIGILYAIPMPDGYENPIEIIIERFLGIITGNYIPGESAESRNTEIEFAMKLATESLYLGVGYGQSAILLKDSGATNTLGISSFYLTTFAETGLIGLLSILALWYWLHRKLIKINRAVKNDQGFARVVFTIRCIFVADICFLFFFGNLISLKYFMTLWLVLSAIIFYEKNRLSFSAKI